MGSWVYMGFKCKNDVCYFRILQMTAVSFKFLFFSWLCSITFTERVKTLANDFISILLGIATFFLHKACQIIFFSYSHIQYVFNGKDLAYILSIWHGDFFFPISVSLVCITGHWSIPYLFVFSSQLHKMYWADRCGIKRSLALWCSNYGLLWWFRW